MATLLKDRVREVTTTAGLGTLTLGGAVTDFRTFASAFTNADVLYYCIEFPGRDEWEVGTGTYSAGTLTRDTILASSNSGSKVNFSAGVKSVFCTVAAASVAAGPSIGGAITDGTANSVLFVNPTAIIDEDNTNFTFDPTALLLKVGSGTTTSAGMKMGYSGTSGTGWLGYANNTPNLTNYALSATASVTSLGATTTVNVSVNNVTKIAQSATAGAGPSVTAGTATTDVNAQSWTQTWNAAGVLFTGLKATITPTAYTANSMLFDFATSGTAHRVRANLTTTNQDLTITGPASGGARLILQGNGATNNHQVTSPNGGPLTLDSYQNGLSFAVGGAEKIGVGTDGDVDIASNLLLGAATIAAGMTNTLGIKNGTAPGAGVADEVLFYSSDISAGNTEPSFYCEGTGVLATGQADSASSVRVKMRINGTEVTLLAI